MKSFKNTNSSSGAQIEKDHRLEADDARSPPSCKAEAEWEENSAWFRQQKYLHNLTEHALHKNEPLIIKNLMHEREPFLSNEDLTEVPSDNILTEEDEEAQIPDSEGNRMPAGTAATIPDSDLPKIVSTIQSCPQGMNKVLKSLQQKFPNIPKSHLRSKVHEISDFVDNHWQISASLLSQLEDIVACIVVWHFVSFYSADYLSLLSNASMCRLKGCLFMLELV
ncbi:hypothetical protein Ancab_000318 [Ancistrocladus abbreviatus]